jgi:hypothetical protein
MTWFGPTDPWPRHQKKDIQVALKYAREQGWSLRKGTGHLWGTIYCSRDANNSCLIKIYGTGANPSEGRKRVLEVITSCEHKI